MRQAQTLNEAQLRRVIHYCRSRRHPVRDETIILVSFYAGLRAKEIAALTVGNIFDEGRCCSHTVHLSAQQSKGGQTRTVYLNQRLRKALREYGDYIRLADPKRPLVCQSKGRSLLSQHNVPAVSGHIQSNWSQGCLKSFRSQDIYYPFGQQGCRRTLACSSCRPFAYIHDTEVHRCEL
jgi:integrase